MALLVTTAGCGHSGVAVYPVTGQVFYQGQPLAGALVHLHAVKDPEQSPPAFATVQADGSFKLTTYAESDGAAAGDYKVTVVWRDEQRNDEGELIIGPDKLQDRYTRPDKSTLKVTIKPGKNELSRFDL